uniref:Uncharacterized protein n=1 Tax=Picea sitchensis TaxID=3332 RepID=A9NQP9_PICSI|nr:unknown [Picea sitchensis]
MQQAMNLGVHMGRLWRKLLRLQKNLMNPRWLWVFSGQG